MLTEIKNDVFFISEIIKEIDSAYYIVFNKKRKCYEVHNKKQIGSSFCITIPYEALDGRTIELVNRTRIENRKKIIQEIDIENEKLEKKRLRKTLDFASELAEKVMARGV